jgi:CHASE3 domain sensor protein
MISRLIRALLVVLVIAAGIAAGYFLRSTDTNANREHEAADGVRQQARAIESTLADVRAAQVAYVARGQSDAFWMGRVSTLLPTLEQQMADFKAALVSPAALADIEPAAVAIENFHKLDARAQDYMKGGDALLASDLIFSDGLETTGTAAAGIETALKDELEARESRQAALRRRELMTLGGGAGAVMLIVMLLGLTGSRRPDAEKGAEPASAPVAAAESRKEPSSEPVPLTDAARLCTEFARLQESKQLPGLLERAARVIDASGIIVWVADPDGRELRPAMSFGYSDQAMARMGTIPREAGNAAAAAYRSAEMRTVNGEGLANGALVAPLVTPDGCIGVLSAEMKGGSEKDERSQALASIFAAQLATLVSPSPGAAERSHAAAQA